MDLLGIPRALSRLHVFSGRDTREQFWPYAAFVLVLIFAAMFAVVAPMMANTFAGIERLAAEHPEQVSIQRTPTSVSYRVEGYHPELMPDFRGVLNAAMAVAAVGVVLVASAVTRRLHDVGLSGLFGLAPLPFLVFGGWGLRELLGSFTGAAGGPDMTLFFALFANNFLYIATLAGLALLLIRGGTPEANRYGERGGDRG